MPSRLTRSCPGCATSQHFERQPGGLGRLRGEHHRARAGVEHHPDPRAVDLRVDEIFAAAPAHDLDRAADLHRSARDEVRQHPIADLAQVRPERVGDRKQQREHGPEQRGLQCLGESPPEQDEDHAADRDADRDLRGEPGKVVTRQAGDDVVIAADQQQHQRQSQSDQQRPQQTALQKILLSARRTGRRRDAPPSAPATPP